MAETARPANCPDLACLCLTSFDERLYWGRLPHKVPHDAGGRDPAGLH